MKENKNNNKRHDGSHRKTKLDFNNGLIDDRYLVRSFLNGVNCFVEL
ncbi:hypothetical protein ACW5R3_02280 [Bizionia sp. KMM 8389]